MTRLVGRLGLLLFFTVLACACTSKPTPRPGHVVASVLSVVDGPEEFAHTKE